MQRTTIWNIFGACCFLAHHGVNLSRVARCCCFFDDVTVTGETLEAHLTYLARVLERFRQHGIRLGLDKCQFLASQVDYLGHIIDGSGVRPSEKSDKPSSRHRSQKI